MPTSPNAATKAWREVRATTRPPIKTPIADSSSRADRAELATVTGVP